MHGQVQTSLPGDSVFSLWWRPKGPLCPAGLGPLLVVSKQLSEALVEDAMKGPRHKYKVHTSVTGSRE